MTAPMPDPFRIDGARVVLDDRIAEVSLLIEDGRIAALDSDRAVPRIDAAGLILAPAFVDIHGDAFERQLMPRPGVMLPTEAALLETDRQLAANGIATAYHALTLSWEPGLRSVETGWEVFETLKRLAPRLNVENRLQLRWETFCIEALPLIEAALAGPLPPSIAFNDHTSMLMRDPGTPVQERPYDHDPAYPVIALDHPELDRRLADRALRAGLPADEMRALALRVWGRRPQVPETIARVAGWGRAAGLAMLSHDDSQPETRAIYREMGARISEFPMNHPTARAARAAGDFIIFGAPNAARGGSHLGSAGAAEMLREGLCDILASDYYYPAMLAAMARLHADGLGDLPQLWPLVSGYPARALGLADRGRIAEGLRADLVLIDWPEGGAPAVRQTFVAGRAAYAARPAG